MGKWNIPEDLRYADNDEWIRLDGEEAVIGITDYAQDQLSDLVYVELPDVGETYAQGESFGVVESVKAASDVYLPIGGEILAINNALEDAPEIINTDPYDKGWIVRIKPSDTSEMDSLMDAKTYEAYCDERSA